MKLRGVIVLIAGLISSAAYCKPDKKVAVKKEAAAQSSDYQVAFINKMVGDKKTWIMVPSNATFKKGEQVNASVVNLLDAAHGFKIPGSVEPMVILPHSETKVTFKANKSGEIAVECHMHPAHVGTKFNVK